MKSVSDDLEMNEREVLSVKRIEASPQIAQMGVSNPVYFFSGSILPKHTDTESALPIIASILLKEKKIYSSRLFRLRRSAGFRVYNDILGSPLWRWFRTVTTTEPSPRTADIHDSLEDCLGVEVVILSYDVLGCNAGDCRDSVMLQCVSRESSSIRI